MNFCSQKNEDINADVDFVMKILFKPVLSPLNVLFGKKNLLQHVFVSALFNAEFAKEISLAYQT